MRENTMTIEEITDPEEIARRCETRLAFRANSNWLHSHWDMVLPQAIGKYVAVAGQEAFISDTWQEAERMALAAHPGEKGIYVRFVNPNKGMRFYGHRRIVANGR